MRDGTGLGFLPIQLRPPYFRRQQVKSDIRNWKIQVRLESDGKPLIVSSFATPSGEVLRFNDYLTGPEGIKDIVSNHLDSAEKIIATRKWITNQTES